MNNAPSDKLIRPPPLTEEFKQSLRSQIHIRKVDSQTGWFRMWQLFQRLRKQHEHYWKGSFIVFSIIIALPILFFCITCMGTIVLGIVVTTSTLISEFVIMISIVVMMLCAYILISLGWLSCIHGAASVYYVYKRFVTGIRL